MGNMQNNFVESFQSSFGKEELLAKVIDCFPYPIEVYAPDGTAVLVNKALLNEYHVSVPEEIVGKYNIFKDPAVIASGQLHMVKRAFQGETVFFRMSGCHWKTLQNAMVYGTWMWKLYTRILPFFLFWMT